MLKAEMQDVTLVCVDTSCHDLTALAVNECLAKCNFGGVNLFSDKQLNIPGVETIKCEAEDITDALRFIWYQVPETIKTSHFLIIQWDSWVLNQAKWDKEFLNYDYVGAPWWYNDAYDVGNGGFCLRSKKLADFIASNSERYPYKSPEDQTICRGYGPNLTELGFRWPSKWRAGDFAFEWVRKEGTKTFGFHDARNFPLVLKFGDVAERIKMMQQNPYIRGKNIIDRVTAVMYELGQDCGYLAGED